MILSCFVLFEEVSNCFLCVFNVSVAFNVLQLFVDASTFWRSFFFFPQAVQVVNIVKLVQAVLDCSNCNTSLFWLLECFCRCNSFRCSSCFKTCLLVLCAFGLFYVVYSCLM